MAVERSANIITITLGNSESLSIPANNEYGVKKIAVRPPSAGTTTITGTAKIETGSASFGGSGISLVSTDQPVVITSLDGETIQGLTISNDGSASCSIIAYK